VKVGYDLRNDFLATIEGESAVIPEIVTGRSADVVEFELRVTILVGGGGEKSRITVDTNVRRCLTNPKTGNTTSALRVLHPNQRVQGHCSEDFETV